MVWNTVPAAILILTVNYVHVYCQYHGHFYVPGVIDKYSCLWKYDTYGHYLHCPDGYVVVGACGSGSFPACGTYAAYTGIRCCASDDGYKGVGSVHHGEAGVQVYCPVNQIVSRVCGSGSNQDCHWNGRTYITSIFCQDSTFRISNTCLWKFSSFSTRVTLACPSEYVLRGMCGSAGTAACDNRRAGYGIYCCEVS